MAFIRRLVCYVLPVTVIISSTVWMYRNGFSDPNLFSDQIAPLAVQNNNYAGATPMIAAQPDPIPWTSPPHNPMSSSDSYGDILHSEHVLLTVCGREASIRKDLWAVLENATSVAEKFGKLDGNSANVPVQTADLVRLARQEGVRTVCEVGFNAGHGALAFLSASPHIQLVEFDFQMNPYAKASRAFVEGLYPGRVTFFVGNSRTTLPAYAKAVKEKSQPACDLFMVDGGHGPNVAASDTGAAFAATRPGGTIIWDDVTSQFKGVQRAYYGMRSRGKVKEKYCELFEPKCVAGMGASPESIVAARPKGWCVATVPERHPDG